MNAQGTEPAAALESPIQSELHGKIIGGARPWKTFGEGPLKVKDGRQGENHAEFSQEDIRFTTNDS